MKELHADKHDIIAKATLLQLKDRLRGHLPVI